MSSIKCLGQLHLVEIEQLNNNKINVENAMLSHKNDITKCFTSESFAHCKKYIIDNFILPFAFPPSSLLHKFATDKDISKCSCATLIDSYTKIK